MIKINKSIIFFLGLCPLIPIVAHVAEGLLFIAEFWLLFVAGIAGGWAVRWFKIKKMQHFIVCLSIIVAAALYVQAAGWFFPVPVMTIEAYMYITAFSYILSISVDKYDAGKEPFELPITYSLLLFGVSVVRDVLAFGSISLPSPAGLWRIPIMPIPLALSFWGSTAGILMLLGIGLWLFRSFQKGELLPFRTDESRRNSV